MTQQCRTAGTLLGAVGRGLVAGAVGTLAMDVVLYALPARRRQTRLRHLGILRRHLQLGRGTGGGADRQAPVRRTRPEKLPPGRAALINKTLTSDLSAHLLYGTVAAATLRLLSPLTRHPASRLMPYRHCGR
jgi:hypothetical protein